MTLDTTPAPTVLPPSLRANLRPGSIATGEMSSKVAVMLSPGMTISVPWGSVTEPAGQQRFHRKQGIPEVQPSGA